MTKQKVKVSAEMGSSLCFQDKQRQSRNSSAVTVCSTGSFSSADRAKCSILFPFSNTSSFQFICFSPFCIYIFFQLILMFVFLFFHLSCLNMAVILPIHCHYPWTENIILISVFPVFYFNLSHVLVFWCADNAKATSRILLASPDYRRFMLNSCMDLRHIDSTR